MVGEIIFSQFSDNEAWKSARIFCQKPMKNRVSSENLTLNVIRNFFTRRMNMFKVSKMFSKHSSSCQKKNHDDTTRRSENI